MPVLETSRTVAPHQMASWPSRGRDNASMATARRAEVRRSRSTSAHDETGCTNAEAYCVMGLPQGLSFRRPSTEHQATLGHVQAAVKSSLSFGEALQDFNAAVERRIGGSVADSEMRVAFAEGTP